MSYPQPKSSKSVLEGQEFFRLHTEFESNGDIYELDTSVKAIVIGPNSDIQNARVYYYDVQDLNSISEALISVDDPFVTRMNALMAQEYPGLGATARVLVTSDDIVPHLPGQYFAVDADNPHEDDIIVWQPPWLDLLCYHRDPPGLPASRSERQWQIGMRIVGRGLESEGVSWYFFPHYRRKYFHARLIDRNAGVGYTYTVYGVTLHPTGWVAGFEEYPTAQMTPLATGTLAAPAAGQTTFSNTVLHADQVANLSAPTAHPIGYFDYMCIAIAGEETGIADRLSAEIIASDWR